MILIVDDRPEEIELTKMALSRLLCEVHTESASTGEQALDFLRTAEPLPDMILLDLKMPGMDGIETLRRIRADKRMMNIPVVIISCSTLESDKQSSLEAGATGFILKAIGIKEFRDDLGRHLKRWICN